MDDAVEVITGFYFGIADKFREGMGINSSTPPEKEETQGLNDVIKVFKTYFKSIDNEEKKLKKKTFINFLLRLNLCCISL